VEIDRQADAAERHDWLVRGSSRHDIAFPSSHTDSYSRYESMGYRKYRDDIERYPNKTLDGKDVWFFATFMRKDLAV